MASTAAMFHKTAAGYVVVLTLFKLLSSFGDWKGDLWCQERGRRALRWIIPALSLAAWLWHPTGRALLFMALGLTYIAALSVPQYLVAWERLIAVEGDRRAG